MKGRFFLQLFQTSIIFLLVPLTCSFHSYQGWDFVCVVLLVFSNHKPYLQSHRVYCKENSLVISNATVEAQPLFVKQLELLL